MKTLLQINAGLHGPDSRSSHLADELAAALLAGAPGARHMKRDLSKVPVPHLDHGTFLAFLDQDAAKTPAQKAGLLLADELTDELVAADTLVLGAPMYNLTIPSTLKAWIDHVSRAGRTFRFTDTGPIGLLEDTRAYVAIAQGGSFLGTQADTQTMYLRNILGFLGITDVEFIHAEGMALGPETAEAGMKAARARIRDLAAAVVCPA